MFKSSKNRAIVSGIALFLILNFAMWLTGIPMEILGIMWGGVIIGLALIAGFGLWVSRGQ